MHDPCTSSLMKTKAVVNCKIYLNTFEVREVRELILFLFFSLVKVKFGEPADQDSQELFGLICQFVHDFKRAHAEII